MLKSPFSLFFIFVTLIVIVFVLTLTHLTSIYINVIREENNQWRLELRRAYGQLEATHVPGTSQTCKEEGHGKEQYLKEHNEQTEEDDKKDEEQNEGQLEWSDLRARIHCDGCFNWQATILLGQEECSKNIRLVIILKSAPYFKFARQVARDTFAAEAQQHDFGIVVKFAVAKTDNKTVTNNLYDEAEKFNDIIYFDSQDSYANLLRKSMNALNWAVNYCNTAKFVLLGDDDILFNIENIIGYLKDKPDGDFVAGKVMSEDKVERTGKWAVSIEDYPYDIYPDFCPGAGVIYSLSTATKMTKIAKDVPLFRLDDVYLTGLLCSAHLQIQPTDIKESSGDRYDVHDYYGFAYSGCLFSNKLLYHAYDREDDDPYQFWNEYLQNRLDKNCTNEESIRNHDYQNPDMENLPMILKEYFD